MTRQTSAYLDLVRFTAAFVVFIGHISSQRLTGGLFWQVGWFMFDAVAVFFALSGFVIAYITDVQERDPTSYAISRLARLYSVVVPTILLTFALDAAGTAIAPGLYSSAWGYVASGKVWQALTALTFTGELWGLRIVPGSAIAYWSLNCEVWYYILFGLAMFARPPWRWPMVAVAALIAGPYILALMPAWLAGVACYKVSKRITLARFPAALLCMMGFALWLLYRVSAARGWIPDNDPLQYWIIACVFSLHLIGFRFLTLGWPMPPAAFQTFLRWIAGGTFTLYLLHVPISQFLAAISPWAIGSGRGRVFIMGGAFLLIMLIAEFTERRKRWWRTMFRALLAPAARLPQAIDARRSQ